jgi:hypothetical protein
MDDFVKIYKDWLATRQQDEKKAITPEQRKVMAVMDNMKKRVWNGLSEERRVEIVAELILDGVLPESVGKCLDIFDAKVVQV